MFAILVTMVQHQHHLAMNVLLAPINLLKEMQFHVPHVHLTRRPCHQLPLLFLHVSVRLATTALVRPPHVHNVLKILTKIGWATPMNVSSAQFIVRILLVVPSQSVHVNVILTIMVSMVIVNDVYQCIPQPRRVVPHLIPRVNVMLDMLANMVSVLNVQLQPIHHLLHSHVPHVHPIPHRV